jgi:acyl phosphate:glycerol-3-phosphate acyltransferase
MIVNLVFAAVLGYLLGSIPFGLLLTSGAGLGDVRKIGSGNFGATNVLRTGRRDLAAATLVLDALKGTAAVLIARWLWGEDATLMAGAAAFIGHCFPVWLQFKGGKGVATYIGVLLGLSWPVGLIFCAVWAVIAYAQRYSSLAGITASATAPIFAYVVTFDMKFAAVAAFVSVLVLYRHWANIERLWKGTEPKIGSEKPKAQ